MAKIFLDTNYFIDAVERGPEKAILKSLLGYTSFISPLSIAVYCYLYKIKVSNKQLLVQLAEFQIVDISQDTNEKSLLGPTQDFEDNIQLHSAAVADCDYFLTFDQKLLKMKFFGKTKITSSLK